MQNVTRLNSEMAPVNSKMFPEKYQAYQYCYSEFMKFAVDAEIKQMKNFANGLNSLFKQINKLPIHEAESMLIAEFSSTGRYDELIKFDGDDYRNLLIINLNRYPNPIARFNQLIDIKIQGVLPEEYLNWFKDDLIASLFLANLVEDQLLNYKRRGTVEFLSSFQDFMRHNIFIFNNSIHRKKLYKKEELAFPQYKVGTLLFFKNLFLLNQIKPKEIKWIERKNKEQIEWAYNYLEEKKLLVLQDTFFPISIDEKYEHIVASLNVLSNIVDNPPFKVTQENSNSEYKYWSERQWIIYQLKQAWKAKKDRLKSTKSERERSVKIYQKNYGKLTQLAKTKKLTVNKLVNYLIEQEIQKALSEDDIIDKGKPEKNELSELEKELIAINKLVK